MKRPRTEKHVLYPASDDYEMFRSLHESGAKRHGGLWLSANETAANAASGHGLDISKPALKRVLSMIVLRVLDRAHPPKEKT